VGNRFGHQGSRFTDFKEHAMIFKGNTILKIGCRLLKHLEDM
jgi:hypothetical protein